MSFLKINNIRKYFGGVKALDDVSFEVEKGEIVGLIGPNGSGKSTLFNAIMNIFPKDSGEVILDDIDVTNKKTYQISSLGISRTFQDAKPLPQVSVVDNIDIAFQYNTDITLFNTFFRRRQLKEEEAANFIHINEMLDDVGIKSKLNHFAGDLSYGQGKLLEVLKVMASDGQLILLDEPFSGLFPEMIKLITKLILRLSEQGKTILLVEHNMQLISEICDKVVVLDAGKVIAEGEFDKVKRKKIVIESYLGK